MQCNAIFFHSATYQLITHSGNQSINQLRGELHSKFSGLQPFLLSLMASNSASSAPFNSSSSSAASVSTDSRKRPFKQMSIAEMFTGKTTNFNPTTTNNGQTNTNAQNPLTATADVDSSNPQLHPSNRILNNNSIPFSSFPLADSSIPPSIKSSSSSAPSRFSSPVPPVSSAPPSKSARSLFSSSVSLNSSASQFELIVDGSVCYLNFEPVSVSSGAGNTEIWNFWETFVPNQLRERGLASDLCEGAFQHCRTAKIKVNPTCSYILKRFLPKFPHFYEIAVDGSGRPLAASLVTEGHIPLPHHNVFQTQWKHICDSIHRSGLIDSSSSAASSSVGVAVFDPDFPSSLVSSLPFSHPNRKLAALKNLYALLTKPLPALNSRVAGLDNFIRRKLPSNTQNKFLNRILPFLLNLILQMPTTFARAELPILTANRSATVTLTHIQCCSLLSCSFFCLLPVSKASTKLQPTNFSHWLAANASGYASTESEKLMCLMAFFESRCDFMPAGSVAFHRHVNAFSRSALLSRVSNCELPLAPMELFSTGTIEDDGLGTLQIDFANKYLGGGVLNSGCVQEEIRFSINPECLVGILFSEKMEENESILIIGAERTANYSGYGRSFKFAGSHTDRTQRDAEGRISTVIVAIDAVEFHNPTKQFAPDMILREIYKSLAGFEANNNIIQSSMVNPANPYDFRVISTGNWGCGAFLGDIPLKACIQIIAASIAGRAIRYFTFGDPNSAGLEDGYRKLRASQVTVKQLWAAIIKFVSGDKQQMRVRPSKLMEFIGIYFDGQQTQTQQQQQEEAEAEQKIAIPLPEPLSPPAVAHPSSVSASPSSAAEEFNEVYNGLDENEFELPVDVVDMELVDEELSRMGELEDDPIEEA